MNSISTIGLCILAIIAVVYYVHIEIVSRKYNVDKPNVKRGVFVFFMLGVAFISFYAERCTNQYFLEKYEKYQIAWTAFTHSSDSSLVVNGVSNTLTEIIGIDNHIKAERNKNFFNKCKKIANLDYIICDTKDTGMSEDEMLKRMEEFEREISEKE